MEAFRTIASRVGSSTGHSPSGTLLGAARAMCAAALYGVDCGVALRPDFPIIIAAPKRRALAETTTATAPLVIPDSSASRRLATTDGSATLASPFASSCDGTADCASQAGIGRKPMLLLLTAGTSVPASSSSSSSSSSSTALGVSPAWGRRSPSHSWGGIFCTDKMLLGASSSWAQQLFVPIWYSTSSGGAYRKAASRNREREAPVIYAVGMFGDINEPKWTPLEFAKANVPLQTVKLVGDKVDKEYTVLTEVAKGWFVSLPLLIEKLKIHGYSFYNPVSISQLMVDKYGQFVIPDGTLLQKTNKRHASNDYFSSASVFEEIIKHSCIDIIPPDSYNDFLMKLRSKEEPHGYYMCVHPTFLPLPSYSQAYLDIYDHVKENLTGHQAREILSCLQITAGLWETIMEGNVLLLAWFHDPLNVRRNQDVERYNFGNPKHLFVYLRHVHSHLLVYIKLFGKYTKDEARVVVDSKFSEVMSKLCWKLWKGQFLVDIQSEAYFCKEGSACCPTPGFCLRRKIRLTLKESRDRKQAAKDQQARHQQAKD